MQMTPLQADCLAYIQFLFASEMKPLSAIYKPSGIMAHIEIESSWQPDVGDHVDSFGSAGLMQVLPATAVQMGVKGSMLDPANSILAGMRYLQNCQTIVGHYREKAGGHLLIEDLVAAYNEGPGNVMRGRQDPRYVTAWRTAQAKWADVDALPVDPKAADALQHWNDHGQPNLTAMSAAPPEPEVAGGLVSTTEAMQVMADLGHNQTPPAETQQNASAPPSDGGGATVAVPAPEEGQVAKPALTEPVSGVEAAPVHQDTHESDAAADGEGPNTSDKNEEAEEAEALNSQELQHLEGAPAQSSGEVAQGEGTGNPSLDGA